MKLVIFVSGLLAFPLSAAARVTHEQASRPVLRLAPRVADNGVAAQPSITGCDNCEKNFTSDQLFALQKRFLENFIAPKNALQVRGTAPNCKITGTDQSLL